jgi:aminopeptidase N
MAEGWLKQTGFPTLSVTSSSSPDRTVTTLHLRQEGDSPEKRWIFPVRIALVDGSGNDLAEVLHRMEKEEDTVEIRSPEPPAFLSVNRGYSFYGRVRYDAPLPELYLQAGRDSDVVNRCCAFMTIMDREKLRMLEDPAALPDPASTGLYYRLLADRDLMMQAGAQFLTIAESVPDKRYTHHYRALYDVRERVLRSIAVRYKEELLELYRSAHVPDLRRDTLALEQLAIKRRQIKNTALALLARLDTPDIHQLVKDQFTGEAGATDTLVAFSLYMDSSAPDKGVLLDAFERVAKDDPVLWENFLSVIAANSSPDVLTLIARVEQSPAFRIEQANDQRALYGRFALNRKVSLQTERGRSFLQASLRKLAPINEHSTVSILRVFGSLEEMDEADQVPLAGILAGLLSDLDPEKTPSVYNTARRILAGAPHAVQKYEEKVGRIPALH